MRAALIRLPSRPSGAPTPALTKSPKKTGKKSAPKSFKADGTPKKRWSSGERAERGHDPRRSGGQPRTAERPTFVRTDQPRVDERMRPEHDANERSYDRGANERSYDRPANERSYDRGADRSTSERRVSDRRPAERRSFDRSNDRGPTDRGPTERSYPPRAADRGPDRRFEGRGERSFDRRDDRGGSDRRDRSFSSRSAPAGSDSSSDQMSWEAKELAPVDLAAVSTTNGFAGLGLPKPLVAALHAQGITTPFPIQAATIPDALAGRDVLGRGQTGSGKTLGFGLPMLATLGGPAKGRRTPRGLVLVPTRELAVQVADVIAPLAKTMDMSVTLIAGGMSYTPQLRAFDRGVDVVIATPGRLIDLMEQGAVDLSRIEVAVLDEADHMADLGFMPAVTTILDAVPVGGQRLLFSATLDGAVNRLVKKYLTDPVTHEVDSARASVTTMDHHVLHIHPHDKNQLTAEIAGRGGRTLVFVRTQRGADRVAEQLRNAGVMAGALHGGLTQGARTRVMAAFKDGGVPVLVATDVAARGIHVDEIGLVLQVDPPAGPKDYLHRAGRTARAGGTGVVVTLVLPHQRKELSRLTSQAGVRSAPLEARPGDEALVEATGSRQPSGVALSTAEYEKLIAPPVRGGGRPRNRKDFSRRDAGWDRGGRGQGRRKHN